MSILSCCSCDIGPFTFVLNYNFYAFNCELVVACENSSTSVVSYLYSTLNFAFLDTCYNYYAVNDCYFNFAVACACKFNLCAACGYLYNILSFVNLNCDVRIRCTATAATCCNLNCYCNRCCCCYTVNIKCCCKSCCTLLKTLYCCNVVRVAVKCCYFDNFTVFCCPYYFCYRAFGNILRCCCDINCSVLCYCSCCLTCKCKRRFNRSYCFRKNFECIFSFCACLTYSYCVYVAGYCTVNLKCDTCFKFSLCMCYCIYIVFAKCNCNYYVCKVCCTLYNDFSVFVFAKLEVCDIFKCDFIYNGVFSKNFECIFSFCACLTNCYCVYVAGYCTVNLNCDTCFEFCLCMCYCVYIVFTKCNCNYYVCKVCCTLYNDFSVFVFGKLKVFNIFKCDGVINCFINNCKFVRVGSLSVPTTTV